MQAPNHPIFRPDAVQRHARGKDAAVMPRFISPPTFRCLWVLLGLLVAGGFVAWFARVPVYASGTAVVVGVGRPAALGLGRWALGVGPWALGPATKPAGARPLPPTPNRTDPSNPSERPRPKAQGPTPVQVVACFPPEALSRLRVGQRMLLRVNPAGEPVPVPVLAVEPDVCSPDAIRARFRLSTGAALAITQPAAVASAAWEPAATQHAGPGPSAALAGWPASTYAGSVYRADVEVGSRRVMALLPLVGRLLGD